MKVYLTIKNSKGIYEYDITNTPVKEVQDLYSVATNNNWNNKWAINFKKEEE